MKIAKIVQMLESLSASEVIASSFMTSRWLSGTQNSSKQQKNTTMGKIQWKVVCLWKDKKTDVVMEVGGC